MSTPETSWRRCSTCKKPIRFGAQYWVCSVSTCNRVRAPLAFCSLSCWDVHVPVMNHREAWAEEKTAPRSAETEPSVSRPPSAAKPAAPAASSTLRSGDADREILVVASKVKDYIRNRSGMNTSASVLDVLSDYIRAAADEAVKNAKQAGRSTVMDRDIRTNVGINRPSPGASAGASGSGMVIRRRPASD